MPFIDAGASNERTALSWQRTALSLVAGSAAMARLTWAGLGVTAAVLLGLAFLLAGWVFVESSIRYRHDAGTRSRGHSRGGRAALALTMTIVLMALTELVAFSAQ